MKKKIKFLCLHLGYGGIETATINSANVLSSKYEVEIVSFYNLNKNQEALLNKKVKVKYLCKYQPNRDKFMNALKKYDFINIVKEGVISFKILFQKKYFIVREIKKAKDFAIISTRVDFSALLSKYGKKDIIKIAQEHHHHNNNQKYIYLLKKKYNNIDYLCALTSGLKKDYELFLKNNNHTKIIVLPNILICNGCQSELNSKNIITVSRLDKRKKIDELITIFSKLKFKHSKLYIIGDGEELNNLKCLAGNLGISDRVIFTGYLNQDEQKKYYLDSCIFAMTSITEGLPMVLLEAMSYGLPCIAYKTDSGVGDIIENNENGYVIDNRNQKEYIEKLDILLKNSNILEKMKKNALMTISKFEPNEIIKIWDKMLSDCEENYERKIK